VSDSPVRRKTTNSNAGLSASGFEAREHVGSAIVHEEDDLSGILITRAPLTDLVDENIFEPGPEGGPISKALGL
jgi:hypothetical protein